ncbi:hypothetical protein GTA08_BOTSDO00031 [Botryosphaeria dothidea]|uniref:Uncharacterized protein n=1 Tax=Botryosphaeria dothidea TaxID=55169 RepID=A0A8H4NC67_9PEZI|nr:hypothetical protein GTA08_BOTSDO00031 [Botryosphaeria dothidea]
MFAKWRNRERNSESEVGLDSREESGSEDKFYSDYDFGSREESASDEDLDSDEGSNSDEDSDCNAVEDESQWDPILIKVKDVLIKMTGTM